MTHTAEEVRANVAENRRHMTSLTESQLTAYAALLERREAGVTDDMAATVAQWLLEEYGVLPPVGPLRRMIQEAVWPVAAEPAQAAPVAYLAENANEAFLFFADDHEGLDAYTADGFSITPLVRHSTPEASCGDCPTRDYKAAEPAQPAERDEIAEEAWRAFYRAADKAQGQPAERVPEGQVDLQSHVMRTAVAHGGLRQLSRNLGIDVGYLSRLANGERTEPGKEILAKLGLEKRVTYLSKQAAFMRDCEQEPQSNG